MPSKQYRNSTAYFGTIHSSLRTLFDLICMYTVSEELVVLSSLLTDVPTSKVQHVSVRSLCNTLHSMGYREGLGAPPNSFVFGVAVATRLCFTKEIEPLIL
jgi:hypothetical protein